MLQSPSFLDPRTVETIIFLTGGQSLSPFSCGAFFSVAEGMIPFLTLDLQMGLWSLHLSLSGKAHAASFFQIQQRYRKMKWSLYFPYDNLQERSYHHRYATHTSGQPGLLKIL